MAENVVELVGTRRGKRPQVKAVRAARWTVEKQGLFLSTLAATANVRASARAAGMSEPGAYKFRARSAPFRAAWQAALSEGYDRLEIMMLDRAMNGVVKAVWYGGKEVGTMTEYSDRTALTLLRVHRETVRGADEAGPSRTDPDVVRQRIERKLDEMHRRLCGEP